MRYYSIAADSITKTLAVRAYIVSGLATGEVITWVAADGPNPGLIPGLTESLPLCPDTVALGTGASSDLSGGLG